MHFIKKGLEDTCCVRHSAAFYADLCASPQLLFDLQHLYGVKLVFVFMFLIAARLKMA